jgi:branched-chain amino acid transport system permease protein
MFGTILDIIIDGLFMGGIYALLSMGLSLQYGVARVLNVSHGEFIMVGAFLTLALHTGLGMNPILTLVIIGPLIFVVGYILHRTLFHFMLKSSPSIEVFEGKSLLATFGLLFIIQNVAVLIWGTITRSYNYLISPIEIGGAVTSLNRMVVLGITIAIGVGFYIFLARTRLGKAIRAAAQDPTTAGILGVNINNVLALCFGFGLLMAGIAGVLYSMCFGFYTTMGLGFTVIAIIVVVLGGLGSIPGSFIGGFILGIVGQITSTFEAELTLAAYYFIFIILLLVRPKGIMGK